MILPCLLVKGIEYIFVRLGDLISDPDKADLILAQS